MSDAYQFTHRNPEIYLLSRKIDLPYENKVPKNTYKIHLHLRFANFARDSERFLEPEYYKLALNSILEEINNSESRYKIVIHSDFSILAGNIQNMNISENTLNYLKALKIIDSNGRQNDSMILEALNFRNFLTNSYHNVEIKENENAFNSFQEMITADYLIASKSSFSYLAALLNIEGEIHSPNYWNKPLKHWIKYSY